MNKKITRSSKTGKFVNEKFASHHPATTERETVKTKRIKALVTFNDSTTREILNEFLNESLDRGAKSQIAIIKKYSHIIDVAVKNKIANIYDAIIVKKKW